MPLHVVEQVPLRNKPFATFAEFASVRPFACVCTHVRLQVTLLGKHLVASLEFALVGHRSAARARGTKVVALRLRAHIGEVAVGCVRIVSKHMRIKVPFCDEVLSAIVATKRSLAGMRAEVRLEVPGLTECLLAVDVWTEVDLFKELQVLVL